jgi:hypothetical protein
MGAFLVNYNAGSISPVQLNAHRSPETPGRGAFKPISRVCLPPVATMHRKRELSQHYDCWVSIITKQHQEPFGIPHSPAAELGDHVFITIVVFFSLLIISVHTYMPQAGNVSQKEHMQDRRTLIIAHSLWVFTILFPKSYEHLTACPSCMHKAHLDPLINKATPISLLCCLGR